MAILGDNICEGGLRAKCFVSSDIYDYIYVSQGKTKVDSIDDDEELLYTEDAFNVLGFAPEEKFDCYVLTAGVMTCGGIVYETKGRDDQAEIADHSIESFPGKAAAAFGVDPKTLFKAFCKPRIKVGTEWVTKVYLPYIYYHYIYLPYIYHIFTKYSTTHHDHALTFQPR